MTNPPELVLNCDSCGHIVCCCFIKEKHSPKCKFRIAATCAIGIPCKHKRDVCPECDKCTCKGQK